MSKTNINKDLRKEVGSRLKEFRNEIMKRSRISFSEFAEEVKIPLNVLKTYEKGESLPGHDDLVKISRYFGLNLNWLYNKNGGMFFSREKDMEEIIRFIESDETGRYEHYKMLLKSMQVAEMEDFIFYVHGTVVELLSKVEYEITNSEEKAQLLSAMTRDVDYQWPRIFGKEPGSSMHRD
jgi:transcriptional regulator with XRE-family HTH domain